MLALRCVIKLDRGLRLNLGLGVSGLRFTGVYGFGLASPDAFALFRRCAAMLRGIHVFGMMGQSLPIFNSDGYSGFQYDGSKSSEVLIPITKR